MGGKLFKELEDEASQLNRLGTALNHLAYHFVGASRQYCVFSGVQFLTLLKRPSLSNKFELKADDFL